MYEKIKLEIYIQGDTPMIKDTDLAIYFKRRMLIMNFIALTAFMAQLLLLSLLIHVFNMVAVFSIPIYLFMLGYLYYFYKKRFVFGEDNFIIQKWGKKEEQYSYTEITCTKVTELNGRFSIELYQQNKKIDGYNSNYKNFMEGLSILKQRNIEMRFKNGEVFDYALPTYIQRSDAQEFASKTFIYLKENYEKVYSNQLKQYHQDYTVYFDKECGENDNHCFYCFVYIMKKGKYIKLISKKNKKEIPGVFAVALVFECRDKKGKVVDGKLMCNTNYENMLSGPRWKNFVNEIKNSEAVLCEQRPKLKI